MKGDLLYPLFDEYDDMIALSIQYTREVRKEKTTYFETYTDHKHVRWVQSGRRSEWIEELNEDIKIGKIAGVYGTRPEPIWRMKVRMCLRQNGHYPEMGTICVRIASLIG